MAVQLCFVLHRLDSQALTEFPWKVDEKKMAMIHFCGDNPKNPGAGRPLITGLLSDRIRRLREETPQVLQLGSAELVPEVNMLCKFTL